MITDDEVMRILAHANPASVDDPIPMLDITGYRDVLDARNTTVTVIDSEPTPFEPGSDRRWPIFLTAAAAAVVAILVVATRTDDVTPANQPSPTVAVSPTTPPRPVPSAQGELEPGTYYVDEVDGTPTPRIFATLGDGWLGSSGPKGLSIHMSDTGFIAFDRPGVVFLDACHPNSGYHQGPVPRLGDAPTPLDDLVAALIAQQGWAEVTTPTDISIDGFAGKAFQRTAPTDMSDCDRRSISPRVDDGEPGYPDFRSWENADGGDGAGGGGFYYEPGGVENVWVVNINGTVVVISTQLWSGPTAAANPDFADDVLDSIRIERWSPELTAVPLEAPIGCDLSPVPYCPHLVVAPDGTLVGLDENGATLTWYEDEPREVSLTNQVGPNILWAIGPHDIAYIGTARFSLVAVAPSGAEITRMAWPDNGSVHPTATGLVPGRDEPNDLLMPWVDLDGNPITDTTLYPTWTATDAGIEVRLGDREWLLTELTVTHPGSEAVDLRPRSDGGVIIVLDTVPGEANLFELLPDGTIERYFVANTWPLTLLPDGSLIVGHNLQLIRLTPPA